MKINTKLQLADLMNNKPLIINIIIILITFFISFTIFKGQIRNIGLLKLEKEQELKRNEVLGNISQLEKKINFYKNILNKDKKDIPAMLNKIRNIANKSALKIISIELRQKKDYPQYIRYSFQLAVNVDSYHTMGELIDNLESYSGVFLVDKLIVKSVEKSRGSEQIQVQRDLDRNYTLTLNLVLTTFVLKG